MHIHFTMKRLIVILFLSLASFQSQSQILITLLLGDKLNSDGLEFGLEGGVNWAMISAMEGNDYSRLWNLGFYFDIRMKNQWSIYTGVLVKSELGVDRLTYNDLKFLGATIYPDIDDPSIDAEGEYSQTLKYFLVPILAKYKFKNHIYAELGPQLGLMYNSWVEFNSDLEGRKVAIREYNTEKINRLDAGLMAGVGYKLFRGTGWTFGAKYYYGLTDVYKDRPGTTNSSFFVKVNIPVGVGKKAEKGKDEVQGQP